MVVESFQKIILDHFAEFGRAFSWREAPHDPYHVLISEVMLQQTQTNRVVEKFQLFIARFPAINVLADAHLHDVLSIWQGLGYNRRAQALHKCAQVIMTSYRGIVPDDPAVLVTLPGIGKATAASIAAFAYNKPTVFIETNIRAVYIHAFFRERNDVADSELMPLVEQTLYRASPRIWYYALMDYGVMLKKKFNNPSKKSAHHVRQSRFEGSERQIRGMIIKLLTEHHVLDFDALCHGIAREPTRILRNLEKLCEEGMISQRNNAYCLGSKDI